MNKSNQKKLNLIDEKLYNDFQVEFRIKKKNTKYIYLMIIKLTTAKCIFRTHIG